MEFPSSKMRRFESVPLLGEGCPTNDGSMESPCYELDAARGMELEYPSSMVGREGCPTDDGSMEFPDLFDADILSDMVSIVTTDGAGVGPVVAGELVGAGVGPVVGLDVASTTVGTVVDGSLVGTADGSAVGSEVAGDSNEDPPQRVTRARPSSHRPVDPAHADAFDALVQQVKARYPLQTVDTGWLSRCIDTGDRWAANDHLSLATKVQRYETNGAGTGVCLAFTYQDIIRNLLFKQGTVVGVYLGGRVQKLEKAAANCSNALLGHAMFGPQYAIDGDFPALRGFGPFFAAPKVNVDDWGLHATYNVIIGKREEVPVCRLVADVQPVWVWHSSTAQTLRECKVCKIQQSCLLFSRLGTTCVFCSPTSTPTDLQRSLQRTVVNGKLSPGPPMGKFSRQYCAECSFPGKKSKVPRGEVKNCGCAYRMVVLARYNKTCLQTAVAEPSRVCSQVVGKAVENSTKAMKTQLTSGTIAASAAIEVPADANGRATKKKHGRWVEGLGNMRELHVNHSFWKDTLPVTDHHLGQGRLCLFLLDPASYTDSLDYLTETRLQNQITYTAGMEDDRLEERVGIEVKAIGGFKVYATPHDCNDSKPALFYCNQVDVESHKAAVGRDGLHNVCLGQITTSCGVVCVFVSENECTRVMHQSDIMLRLTYGNHNGDNPRELSQYEPVQKVVEERGTHTTRHPTAPGVQPFNSDSIVMPRTWGKDFVTNNLTSALQASNLVVLADQLLLRVQALNLDTLMKEFRNVADPAASRGKGKRKRVEPKVLVGFGFYVDQKALSTFSQTPMHEPVIFVHNCIERTPNNVIPQAAVCGIPQPGQTIDAIVEYLRANLICCPYPTHSYVPTGKVTLRRWLNHTDKVRNSLVLVDGVPTWSAVLSDEVLSVRWDVLDGRLRTLRLCGNKLVTSLSGSLTLEPTEECTYYLRRHDSSRYMGDGTKPIHVLVDVDYMIIKV